MFALPGFAREPEADVEGLQRDHEAKTVVDEHLSEPILFLPGASFKHGASGNFFHCGHSVDGKLLNQGDGISDLQLNP